MTEKENYRPIESLTSLDAFLDQEGIREEVTDLAIKQVIALQLAQAMKERRMTQTAMARSMDTSRAQLARILDPQEFNVSLDTLNRAAKAVGRQLKIELA